MKKLSLIVCFALVSSSVFSQWFRQNPFPEYHPLTSVYFPSADIGFAVGFSGATAKTMDGGITWNTLASGTTTMLNSVFFINVDTGYVVGGDYNYGNGIILKTTDGGASWAILTNELNLPFLNSVCFTDSITGYAVGGYDGSEGIILKTTDAGKTWITVTRAASQFNSIYFTDADTGYVAGGYSWSDGIIMKTVNRGTSWTVLLNDTIYKYNSVYFTDSQTGYAAGGDQSWRGIISKTIDGGLSWTAILPDTIPPMNSIFFTDSGTGYVAGYDVIFKTEDAGATWVKSFYTFAGANKFASVYFLDDTTGFALYYCFMRSSRRIILKTIDGGNTWDIVSTGNTSNLNSVFFTDANTGYAAGWGTILKTNNCGRTWNSLYSGRGLTSVYFPDSITGYAVGNSCHGDCVCEIIKTIDSGMTWNTLLIGFPGSLNSIFFTDTATGYAVGRDGYVDANDGLILKTIDGGANWDTLSSGTNFTLNSVFFIDASTGYVAGGRYIDYRTEGIILKTEDGGISWSTLSNGEYGYLCSIYFADANTGYAVGDSVILKTIDAGANWSVISTIGGYSVCFPDTNTGYVVGDNGILKTIDGGETWSLQSSGTSCSLKSVFFTNDTSGYIVGEGGIILSTTTAGGPGEKLLLVSLSESASPAGGQTYFRGPYVYGSNVELIANTYPGYKFINWTENGKIVGSDSVYSFVITANRKIVANYAQLTGVDAHKMPFSVYPNPATTKITITPTRNSQGEIRISIFSMNGQLIRSEKFLNTDGLEMDISMIPEGIYLLKIQTNVGVETQKLVLY